MLELFRGWVGDVARIIRVFSTAAVSHDLLGENVLHIPVLCIVCTSRVARACIPHFMFFTL